MCENTSAEFAQVLFMLAHKPTKVSFNSIDPKSGDSFDPETGAWTASKTNIDYDKVIKDKWNTAVHANAETRVVEAETQGSGTVPKW